MLAALVYLRRHFNIPLHTPLIISGVGRMGGRGDGEGESQTEERGQPFNLTTTVC